MNDLKLRTMAAGLLLVLAFAAAPLLPAATGNDPDAQKQPVESSGTGKTGVEEGQAEITPPPGPETPPAKPKPLKEFKPTESIKADSAVAFPIDI
jgi:hypothetical protein